MAPSLAREVLATAVRLSLLALLAAELRWDRSGYVLYCPCMGNSRLRLAALPLLEPP